MGMGKELSTAMVGSICGLQSLYKVEKFRGFNENGAAFATPLNANATRNSKIDQPAAGFRPRGAPVPALDRDPVSHRGGQEARDV